MKNSGQRKASKRLITSKKLDLPEDATPEEVFKLLLRHFKQILPRQMDPEFRFNTVVPAVLKTLSMVRLQLDDEDQAKLKEMLVAVHQPREESNVRALPVEKRKP